MNPRDGPHDPERSRAALSRGTSPLSEAWTPGPGVKDATHRCRGSVLDPLHTPPGRPQTTGSRDDGGITAPAPAGPLDRLSRGLM